MDFLHASGGGLFFCRNSQGDECHPIPESSVPQHASGAEPVASPVNADVGTSFPLQFTTLAFPNEL